MGPLGFKGLSPAAAMLVVGVIEGTMPCRKSLPDSTRVAAPAQGPRIHEGKVPVPSSVEALDSPRTGSVLGLSQQQLPKSLIPNEPAGFAPFAEFSCDRVPGFPRSQMGSLGSWWAFPKINPKLAVEEDRDAPVSPPLVLRSRFPRGHRGGLGPVDWGGWDSADGAEGEKNRVYLSIWLKIEGGDFENQRAGTKAGFLAVGRDHKGENEVFFWLDNGTGRQAVQPSFLVLIKQQGIPQPNGEITRNLRPNVVRTPVMTAGRWHQWEAIFELNEIGQANGKVRMWIDRRLVMAYDDVVFVTPATPHGFHLFKWNPTWGGSGGIRTRQDDILIDHLYLSGTKDERPRS